MHNNNNNNYYIYIYIYVGAYYLESTIKIVYTGPMIQWPNLRMAK